MEIRGKLCEEIKNGRTRRTSLEECLFHLVGQQDPKNLIDILSEHRNEKKRKQQLEGADIEDTKRLQEYRKLIK